MHKIYLWSCASILGMADSALTGCRKDNSYNSERSGIVTFQMETPDLQVLKRQVKFLKTEPHLTDLLSTSSCVLVG